MIKSFIRLLVLICLGSFFAPVVTILVDRYENNGHLAPGLVTGGLLLLCAAILLSAGFYYLLRRLKPFIDRAAAQQADFLDNFPAQYVGIAIMASAALSLFLELAIIRWQATVFEFFSFYKNFGLLSCFVGLGLGYALASRNRIPLLLTIPLMAWQFCFMIVLRFGLQIEIHNLPFREQLNMGVATGDRSQALAVYTLLALVFLMTALAFIPVGQLCGRLMARQNKLKAYGLNLIGSLLGVLLMLLASLLWTPPLVWFAVCCLAIVMFHQKAFPSLRVGIVSTIFCAIILVWPINPLWQRLYSPYQLLEIGHDTNSGLMLIRAAGLYYQRVFDFGKPSADPRLIKTRQYYDFPYKAQPKLGAVAVVGAGTGNDVAAALRNQAGRVDAIEIDPAILLAGKANHPEKPYSNPRVRAIVNDARSFLRTTDNRYDLIVYGLLDSHTLLSQASSVRLDGFVYTVEGLRDARRRLKDDGVLSLSFAVLNDGIARKIYLMLQQVFDGRAPICVTASYDGAVIFMESNDKNWSVPPGLLTSAGFEDRTVYYGNRAIRADVSTDDWPFFYMPRRVYPLSYLLMVFQILILACFLTGNFIAEKPEFSNVSFFFLGVGFMLVETKGITELGLTFGNTWEVIGVVIASILIMAFLANCTVQWLNIRRPWIPYLLLAASLFAGFAIARAGGFSSTAVGRFETAAVLTCPLFFSGMVFSTLVSTKGELSGIMAMNLLGAVCGGLFEYNSMYLGFQSLYLLAMGFYLLAFITDLGASVVQSGVVRQPAAASTACD